MNNNNAEKLKTVFVEVVISRDGKFLFDNDFYKKTFFEFIRQNKGHAINVSLSREKRPRTIKQNSFFHGVIIPAFCKAVGYDHNNKDDFEYMKLSLKEKFLSKKVFLSTGESKEIIRETAVLKVEEFIDFIESCLFELAECGGSINYNEYQDFMEFKNRAKNKRENDDNALREMFEARGETPAPQVSEHETE